MQNTGSDVVSEILLSFPENQASNLAYLKATLGDGKGKSKPSSGVGLPVEVVRPKDVPPSLTIYSVSLPKGLGKGDSLTLDVLAVFTHSLQPFPETTSPMTHKDTSNMETLHSYPLLRQPEASESINTHRSIW